MPDLIGGYFCRLAWNTPMILTIGMATQVFNAATSRSSFRSVSKLMIFGSGSYSGTSYMLSCLIRCIFQSRHLTAVSRSAT